MSIDAATDSDRRLFAPGRRALTAGLVALIAMIAFESLAVATAMPTVAVALDGLPLYALAFGITLASSLIAMVLAGHDADRHGPWRATVAGLVLFATGLGAAGLAPDMTVLLAGRLLQGLGIGAIGVTLYVAVGRLYPEALRPRVFALFSTAWLLPGIVGPGLAGLMVDTLGWRSVFLALLPPLLLAAALLLPPIARLPAPRAPVTPTPVTGAAGWALLAGVVALAVHESGAHLDRVPWPAVLASWLLFALAGARLLPAGVLLAARGLPTVILLRALSTSVYLAAEVFLPLWLQHAQDWTPSASGLALSAGAVCWSAGSHLQSRIDGPGRRRRVLRLGLAISTCGVAAITIVVGGLLPAGAVLAAWALAGLGIGMASPTLSVLLLQLADEHEKGRASSALQLCDALANTGYLAMFGLLLTWWPLGHGVTGLVAVFALSSALVALAALLVPRVQAHAES